MVLEAQSNGECRIFFPPMECKTQYCQFSSVICVISRKISRYQNNSKNPTFYCCFSFCYGVTICSFRCFFNTQLGRVCAKCDCGPEQGSEMGSEQGARAAIPSMHSPFWPANVPAAGKPLLPVCLKANQLVLFQFAFVSHPLFITFVCHFCHFIELPRAAVRILSNMTFLFVSLSYTAESAIVTAFITFIPKFIESQFGIPASNASIYTGKALPRSVTLQGWLWLMK